MIKAKWIALFTGLMLLSGAGQAQVYHSEFGFEAVISEDWVIVSRATVSQNPQLLDFESHGMSGFGESVIDKIRQMAETGRFELLYYRLSDDDFHDNVNLFISSPEPTDLALGLHSLCKDMQVRLQSVFKRTEFTEVYYCQQGENPLIDMLIYAFDGAVIGTRSFGYVFNTEAGTVTMTLTCKVSKCDQLKADAERIFLEMKI